MPRISEPAGSPPIKIFGGDPSFPWCVTPVFTRTESQREFATIVRGELRDMRNGCILDTCSEALTVSDLVSQSEALEMLGEFVKRYRAELEGHNVI